MSDNLRKIEEITSSEYKYGFITDIKEDRIPNGLNKEIVKKISSIKNEPKWLLDWRLKSLSHWFKNEENEPEWANIQFPKIDFQDIRYYSSPTNKPNPIRSCHAWLIYDNKTKPRPHMVPVKASTRLGP